MVATVFPNNANCDWYAGAYPTALKRLSNDSRSRLCYSKIAPPSFLPRVLMQPRRTFLNHTAHSFAGLATATMLFEESAAAATTNSAVEVLHHPAKAKRVIQLFMGGAASHVDLWDHKPALEKHHGAASDFGEHVETFQNGLGPWMKSPFQFAPYGECGKMLSDVVSPLADCVDDIAFIHNMVGKTGVHSQATYLQATGFQRPGFPGMGAWSAMVWER